MIEKMKKGGEETKEKYHGSFAEAYAHYSGDTFIPVSMFHKGFGTLAGGTKAKVGESIAAKEALEALKQGFLQRMNKLVDDETRHSFGEVNKGFIEESIRLAQGDWNDPTVIEALVNQFDSVKESF